MTPAIPVDKDRLFSIFSNLLVLESESKAEIEVATYVRNFLENIGLEVLEDEAGRLTGGNCGNLIAKLIPSKRGSIKPIMLNAHMDTVASTRGLVYREDGGKLESSGETILGADDKAGIAITLSVVEALKREGIPCPIEVVFTVQEEIGLVGAKKIDFAVLESGWGLVLDGSGAAGGIVIEAPGREDLTFSIRGKAAHAGIEPEKGKNSIECAARAIANLDTGRLSDDTTSNIGVIHGGVATNVVPEMTKVMLEIRSLDERKLSEEKKKIVDAFEESSRKSGCGLELEAERSFDHFRIATDSPEIELLCEAMRKCAIEPSFERSGGGSDANVFNKNGIKAVNLNVGVYSPHSNEEYVRKDEMAVVADVILCLAEMLARKGGLEG